MIQSLRVSYKTFLRKKTFSFSYGLLIIITNTLLLLFFSPNQSAGEFLSDTMRAGQLGISCFMFLAYELFSTLVCKENIEVISTRKDAVEHLVLAQFIILFLLIFSWSVNLFLWQVGVFILTDVSYILFLFHSLLSIILNCFIPACVGSLLGAILALSVTRTKAYCFILLFLLLSSNIPSQVFASEELIGFLILDLWDWFALLAPNTDYIADSIYGIANEECRWILALFWISLFSVILIWKIRKSSRFTRYYLLAFIPLLFFSGLRFAGREEDSIIRKDWRPNGLLVGESSYRAQSPVADERRANFEIAWYNIKIDVSSNMAVNAILSLKQNSLSSYDFTLWHTLEISNITDEQGNSLTYDRLGDFVTVYAQNSIQEIHFEYAGNCGKYFSNHQGIALPGYIPYYPMAGHFNLWCDSDQSIKVYNEFPQTLFHIEIDSPLTVLCNLPILERNVYEGITDTVSLYAGILTTTQVGDNIYHYSPVSKYHVELEGYEQIWEDLSKLVGETQSFDLCGKTIFAQPETIMVANAIHERIILFDDHVILDSRLSTAELICQEYLVSLIPEDPNKQLILNLFEDSIIVHDIMQKVVEKPSWDEIKILADYASSSEIADINEWKRYNIAKKTTLKTLWDYQVTAHSRTTVLKEVYNYLISPENQINQIEFLYNLLGE